MVLNPVISKLTGKLVVLASASPRRVEILRNAGLRFEVVPSWFKETLDKRLFSSPYEYAVENARQKTLEVARRMSLKHLKTPDIVIGADTIVTVGGMILEKPKDKDDAYRMLSSLSGKEHSVFTGVAIMLCHEEEHEEIDYQLIDFFEETKVKFADLSEDMLWEYINSGEPMDKAGGYGIQALGGMLVEYVHGDFLNVVGFPLNHFCKQLGLIYNHTTSSSEQEDKPVLHHNGTDPTHSTDDTAAQSSCSSSAEHNASCGAERSSPSAHGSHLNQSSPSDSPAHKVKKKSSESEVCQSSCTLSNGMSKHTRGGEHNGTEEGEAEPTKEDLERIMELMDGFKASKALFAACKFRVFDVLHRGRGLAASQVAQHIKASVKGTERLLEACASLRLLKSTPGACQRPVYENTELAERLLRTDASFSLLGYIQHCNDTVWPLFSHLESAVLDGGTQHGKAFCNKSKEETCSNSQEVKRRFMKAMDGTAKVTANTIATAFDLSAFKTACDLGGCTGALACELTKAHRGLSVTVFDLPAVIELRDGFHPVRPADRVSFVAGDFFQDELPKADLYILVRILHDLPDEKVCVLLRKIADACTPGCGVLLSEIFLEEDRSGPTRALLQALSMSEGKQRSAADYSRLLESYGFTTAHTRHTDSFLDAMLCIKV